MKRSVLSKVLSFTLVAISLAQDYERELHRGDGGGGRNKDRVEMAFKSNCYWGPGKGDPLFTRITEECDKFDCPGGEGDKTYTCLEWEYSEGEVVVEGCDEDITNKEAIALRREYTTALKTLRKKIKKMSKEERKVYREQKKVIRQWNAENARKCACCTSDPEFEVGELTSVIEGTVARALGFRCPKGKRSQHVGRLQDNVNEQCTDEYKSTSCPSTLDIDTECALEKPKKPDEAMKEELQALKDEFFAQVLKCACCAELTVAELLGYTSDDTSSTDGASTASYGSDSSASVEALLGLDPKHGTQLIFPRPGSRPYKHKPHRRRQRGH